MLLRTVRMVCCSRGGSISSPDVTCCKGGTRVAAEGCGGGPMAKAAAAVAVADAAEEWCIANCEAAPPKQGRGAVRVGANAAGAGEIAGGEEGGWHPGIDTPRDWAEGRAVAVAEGQGEAATTTADAKRGLAVPHAAVATDEGVGSPPAPETGLGAVSPTLGVVGPAAGTDPVAAAATAEAAAVAAAEAAAITTTAGLCARPPHEITPDAGRDASPPPAAAQRPMPAAADAAMEPDVSMAPAAHEAAGTAGWHARPAGECARDGAKSTWCAAQKCRSPTFLCGAKHAHDVRRMQRAVRRQGSGACMGAEHGLRSAFDAGDTEGGTGGTQRERGGASTYTLQHLHPLLLPILGWLENAPEEVRLICDRILGDREEPHLAGRATLLQPARQAAALLRAQARHAALGS